MTLRRTLFGLAALAAVVLVGLPVVRLVRPDAPAVLPELPARTEAAPTTAEPVRLGSDEPLPEPVDVPDWEALNAQTTTVAGRARE
ncbi:MAG TPA: hypothetical protein VF576_04545, partial [Rubricoccaceae bacterium]